MKRIYLYIILFFSLLNTKGQNRQNYLPFKVANNGDTLFMSSIKPARIFSGKKRSLKKHYKLVYNFSKVYPFALLGRKLKHHTDSVILADHLIGRKKDKYVNKLQKQLLTDLGNIMRHLTISQGALLIKLVDRETGTAGYTLIRDYKNKFAAAFWQGLAKMFDNNLKEKYDPYVADKDTEYLVKIWQKGEFNDYYYSIFWEYPKYIELPSKYR